jgi:hypothetical protein
VFYSAIETAILRLTATARALYSLDPLFIRYEESIAPFLVGSLPPTTVNQIA